ncbi:MAG: hypothetical protein ACOVQM_02555, partial [Pirellula sp.]
MLFSILGSRRPTEFCMWGSSLFHYFRTGIQRSLLLVVVFTFNSLQGFSEDKMPTKVGSVEGINEYVLENGMKV